MTSLSNKYKLVDPKSIIIPPDRQRSGGAEIDTSDIEPSIKARGIYHPIIVTEGMILVTGERRTRAALKLGLKLVPIRFDGELSPIERKIVELEENERRADLPWRDHVASIAELHKLYGAQAEQEAEPWSAKRTAEMLFYDTGHLSKVLRIARDLASPKITGAPTLAAAYNILSRLDERRIGDAISSIGEASRELPAKPQGLGQPQVAGTPEAEKAQQAAPQAPQVPSMTPAEGSILQQDFLEWVRGYSGPKFNFIHCDFPYGINLFDGEQGGKGKSEGYDDDPNVYWKLIEEFCKNRDRFLAASSHIMFWLSVDFIGDTIELFAKLAPELRFNPKPLIWSKTDNVGVLADPKRGPRHIYETALIASREDRFIVRATSDWYGSTTDKAHHPSTKPEPMLRYFMQMFVDEHTTMFDPTCGSGSSLRAAESLGAAYVLGLEKDPDHCSAARSALKQFRAKALMAKMAGRGT